ncbi:MAG: hypothetical protein KDK24_02805 [Pseudooceanicola sp.]|nr:hypothetical protein [Pseudooceanicola sp.]
MADDAATALKLAKENEKQVNLLWKNLAANEKKRQAWEKEQQDYIQRVEKNLVDAVNDVNKRLTDAGKIINENEKNQMTYIQAIEKNLIKGLADVQKWVEKEFSKKGIFG